MNILIDIGHPAHVHLYRNIWSELIRKGHKITITVKQLTSATELLDLYGMPYLLAGSRGRSLAGKGLSQILFNYRLWQVIMHNRIELAAGSSITAAQVSRISPARSVILDDDDDEVQPLMTRYGHPFAHCLLSPDALRDHRRKKGTVFYAGYHELAYLHPCRFTPDPSVMEDAGIKKGERYFIMRFNAFRAHHDIGIRGLSVEQKRRLIEVLLPYGKVFITTEQQIEPEFEQFRLKVRPDRIHSLIYYSTMLIGDSQTMTSEAAVLGTPSFRCNSFAGRISYLDEQEKKYGLTFGFLPAQFEEMLIKINSLLGMSDLKVEWQKRRLTMLADKIDVTAFMVWFLENYPQSRKIMVEDPSFQYNFRTDKSFLANNHLLPDG